MKANYIYIISYLKYLRLSEAVNRLPEVFFIDIFISLGLVYAEYIVPRQIYEK